MYESDFIFAVLLQIAIERDVRFLSNCLSAEFDLALESVEIQKSKIKKSEKAAQKILTDILRYAERGGKIRSAEKLPNKIYGGHRYQERTRGQTRNFLIISRFRALQNQGEKTMKNLNRQCVLYADDNEDAGFMVSVTLGFSDIEVTIAKTITEAWDLAQNAYFDLYLLDSRFPDGNGLDLCRRLRGYAPHTPILFYSGDAYETDRQKGLAAGADDYLTKPYFNDLAETILETIKLSKRSAFNNSDNFAPVENIEIRQMLEMKTDCGV